MTMTKTIFALAGVLCFGAFAVEKHDYDHDHDHAAHGHDHAQHDHGAEKHGHDECDKHDHDHGRHDKHDHKDHDGHGHADSDGHDHGPAAKAVEVTAAVQKVMGLKTVRPEKRRLASTVAFTGRYELSPDARRTVATPVAGRLALLVKPLARVKKGDALFTVTSSDLAARARELAVLEKRLDVYRKLGTKNAQLASECAVKKAEREVLVGDAEEKDGVVTVRAASDGLVEAFPSEAGAWVETGASVVRLVDPEALRLRALVAASDAARLADGFAATVEGVPGEIRLGVGDANGLVPVYVVFPRGGAKGRAGARATASCVLDAHETPVTAVPTRCLGRIGRQPTVFVRDGHDADRFLAVDVVPGLSAGGWTAVTGLPSDADLDVVVEGAYELKLALPSGDAKPAGHFHADGTFHEGAD